MHVVMVPDLIPPTDEIRKLCDAVLDCLDDVLPYFDRLSGLNDENLAR